MDETSFDSFMAVLSEINERFNQIKFRSKLFLPTKFTFTNTFFWFFNFGGKNNLCRIYFGEIIYE